MPGFNMESTLMYKSDVQTMNVNKYKPCISLQISYHYREKNLEPVTLNIKTTAMILIERIKITT